MTGLFNNGDKKILRDASTKSTQDYFSNRQYKLKRYGWLNLTNRYRRECVDVYKKDLDNLSVDHAELSDYICASAPAHSIDGWSFLSRSVEALLRGDSYSAIHFAYYAELRAAMSLLACEGICVLSTRHPIISPSSLKTRSLGKATVKNSRGNEEKRFLGTHAIVWPLLEHWSRQKKAAVRLDQLIAPDGAKLSEWFVAAGIALPTTAIAKEWFSVWGMDLPQLDEDHRMRNLASYRPSQLRLPPATEPQRLIDFVTALWTLFEPGSGRRFINLERCLLRKALRRAGGSISSKVIQKEFGLDTAIANDIETFLAVTTDPLPIQMADKKLPIENPDAAMAVISRAALLLFLSTSSTRQILVNAGHNQESTSFFLERQLENMGIVLDPSMVDDPFDIWANIQDNIDEAIDWKLDPLSTGKKLGAWRNEQPVVVNNVSGFELAGVWGILP